MRMIGALGTDRDHHIAQLLASVPTSSAPAVGGGEVNARRGGGV
jgi:hypothetical protein